MSFSTTRYNNFNNNNSSIKNEPSKPLYQNKENTKINPILVNSTNISLNTNSNNKAPSSQYQNPQYSQFNSNIKNTG